MPDPFDFDDARQALDEVPAPDLWDEASQRAGGGAVVPLDSLGGPRRPRWLAAAGVAAVAVLAVGTVAVLLDDDDQAVDTTPVTEPPADPATTIGGGDVCLVGISGDPIAMAPGPADPPLFDTSGQPEGQLVAHTMLGSQVAELHVPGLVLTDLVGERVEEVELARGTASIWFGPDFVQVRWFTGGQELCESFTVTVAGGTEDGNRHAAVDLADRVLLPSDLAESPGAALGTIEGEWQLVRSSIDGGTDDVGGLSFTFSGGTAEWTDGCNTFAGGYGPVDYSSVRVGVVTFTDVTSSAISCPTNTTAAAVRAVMGAERIEIAVERGGELLVLSANDATLTLHSLGGDGEPAAGPELAGTEWRVAALYRGDEVVPGGALGATPIVTFGDTTVAWHDRCSSSSGTWSVDADGYLVVTDTRTTLVGCPDVDERTQAWEVIGAVMGAERIYMDEMGGQLELSDPDGNHVVLEPA